jgi:carbon monoxide dehydrogenase subunit G
MPVLEERFEVAAPPEAVWEFLLDPTRLGPCIPGCTGAQAVDASTWRLSLTVKVGFLSTTQEVRLRIAEAEPPRRLVSEGRGEDPRLGSQVDVRSTIELVPVGPGATAVAYRSEIRVLGRLGSVGDAVMRAKARELAGQFASRVRVAIEGGSARETA